MESKVVQDALARFSPSVVAGAWHAQSPRLLVVTDAPPMEAEHAPAVAAFIEGLRSSPVQGMSPRVDSATLTTACMGNGCGALIAAGPLRAHCDVLFLLGLRPCDERCADEVLRRLSLVSRIEQFMREGGGVFASARPGSLLSRLCEALPRLRHMGGWSDEAITPGKGDAQHRQKSRPAKRRLALACTQPARLYLDFRSPAGGVGHPHPLLQSPPPLHWLDVPFDTAGADILPPPLDVNTGGAEWPLDAAGQSVSVEAVALCAGGRSGPVSRSPLPALAPAILAYDGERVGMGRIAVDENIDHVLQAPVDSDRSMRLDAYHANLASWLLPRDCRLQARVPRLLMELRRYPLYEELAAVPWPEATPEDLLHVSEQVMVSLRTRLPAWEAQALIDDTLDEAAGDEAWLRFDHAPGIGLAPAIESLEQAALGGFVTGLITALQMFGGAPLPALRQRLSAMATLSARRGLSLLLKRRREERVRRPQQMAWSDHSAVA